jgi:hypothetical protein
MLLLTLKIDTEIIAMVEGEALLRVIFSAGGRVLRETTLLVSPARGRRAR